MNEKNETIITSSTHTEMLILGSMINNEEHASICLNLVKNEDFFETKHKIIFETIQTIFHEKKLLDITLLTNKLKEDSKIEYVGGLNYLLDISCYAGTSCHVESYCDDLKKLTQIRQLIALRNSLSTDLIQGASPSKIIEKFKDKIESIEKYKTQDESHFRYLLENNSEKQLVEELQKTSPGVSTGFKIGEELIEIQGGAISVVAMPTSHGKTAALINFSLGVLNHHHDKSVYFFSYEENGASIQSLFINTWIGKEISENNRKSIKSYFRDGNMKYMNQEGRASFENDKKTFFEQITNKGRLKVFYSDMPVEELISAIRFINKKTNVGLVCIDYMQMLKLLRGNQGSRQEELKQICLMLKNCAVETGVPILIGAQFNREVVAEADLSPAKIGEAGDIERIANLIIGGWNRNFEGFSRDGNFKKGGKKELIPKEPAIYFEIMKGRGIGNGHYCVMDFNGNTGKLSNRVSINRIDSKPINLTFG